MKFKYIFMILSVVFVLGACDEEVDISVIEDDIEVVNSNVSEDDEESDVSSITINEEIAEFTYEITGIIKVTDNLMKELKQPTGTAYNDYKNSIENFLITLKMKEFSSPTTKEEKAMIEQYKKVKYQLETTLHWATERLVKWESVHKNLYNDERATLKSEYDILLKMIRTL